MPSRSRASEILNLLHDVERRLTTLREGSPEHARLIGEQARLRDLHREALGRPEAPPIARDRSSENRTSDSRGADGAR